MKELFKFCFDIGVFFSGVTIATWFIDYFIEFANLYELFITFLVISAFLLVMASISGFFMLFEIEDKEAK